MLLGRHGVRVRHADAALHWQVSDRLPEAREGGGEENLVDHTGPLQPLNLRNGRRQCASGHSARGVPITVWGM